MIITFENIPLTLKSSKCEFINMQECEGLESLYLYCDIVLGHLRPCYSNLTLCLTVIIEGRSAFCPHSPLHCKVGLLRVEHREKLKVMWSWIVTEYIASLLTPNVISSTSWHFIISCPRSMTTKMSLWHWTWKVPIIGLLDTNA